MWSTKLPIEYLATCYQGIAYVLNVEQWNNVNSVYGDIQYSLRTPSRGNPQGVILCDELIS
ncbi:5616_t:CDS:2 [Rhizophagus irregularis]|nr:5616_t:CDS:2 [Rhizophagus irregularis]